MDEEWNLIRDIMDWRLLVSARDQHNQDATQMQPSQIQIWKEMIDTADSDG